MQRATAVQERVQREEGGVVLVRLDRRVLRGMIHAVVHCLYGEERERVEGRENVERGWRMAKRG